MISKADRTAMASMDRFLLGACSDGDVLAQSTTSLAKGRRAQVYRYVSKVTATPPFTGGDVFSAVRRATAAESSGVTVEKRGRKVFVFWK